MSTAPRGFRTCKFGVVESCQGQVRSVEVKAHLGYAVCPPCHEYLHSEDKEAQQLKAGTLTQEAYNKQVGIG